MVRVWGPSFPLLRTLAGRKYPTIPPVYRMQHNSFSPCLTTISVDNTDRSRVRTRTENISSADVLQKSTRVFQKPTVRDYLNPRKQTRRCFGENRQTKSLTIWSDLKEVRSSPVPALALGFSGLIPFVAAPGFMILTQAYVQNIAFAQVMYGATILSFLGGVRWGFTISEESVVAPDWYNLGYSVTPPLVAWVGLLLPIPFSLFTMMGGLAGAAYFDSATWGYPPWFKGMRFALSFVAILALWSTFMCSFLLEEEGKKDKIEDKSDDSG